jgi:hypothetical protein
MSNDCRCWYSANVGQRTAISQSGDASWADVQPPGDAPRGLPTVDGIEDFFVLSELEMFRTSFRDPIHSRNGWPAMSRTAFGANTEGRLRKLMGTL